MLCFKILFVLTYPVRNSRRRLAEEAVLSIDFLVSFCGSLILLTIAS